MKARLAGIAISMAIVAAGVALIGKGMTKPDAPHSFHPKGVTYTFTVITPSTKPMAPYPIPLSDRHLHLKALDC